MSAMSSSSAPCFGAVLLLTWLCYCTFQQANARSLVEIGPMCGTSNTSCSLQLQDQLRQLFEAVDVLAPAPGQTIRGWRSERAYFLESTAIDWRPLFVLGLGEGLGHVVRGVTGFGSAIVLVSVWTICKTAGMDAGPFQSLIFADSICALSTTAPLLYVTKPWKFASWRLVVTLLAFQAIGAPLGAYLVLRLDPARLNFAIATALLVLFLLMVCPLEACIRRMQSRARPSPAADLTQPLLAADPEAGPKARTRWWQRWLRRGRVSQQGRTAPPAGVPAGATAAPDQSAANSSNPAGWPSRGVHSPFQDASQQPSSPGQGQEPRFVFSENPLLLSRKQSDSANSLRLAGSGKFSQTPEKQFSIREHPEEHPGAVGEGADSLGGLEQPARGGTSGVDGDAVVLEGGPSGPAVAGSGDWVPPDGGEEPRGSGSSGGYVSGDSDLVQAASAGLGSVVIGIMPDSELSHSVRLVDRSASQKAAEWTMDTRTLIGSAALAATCSGMLGSLSGITGPPLILMFQLLAVPKRVVRATMVMTSAVSIKLITFLLLGSARASDVPMYCLGIACSYIGINIGNALAKRLNQQAFGKVLLGVMLLSTCLLYASSFGLTEH